MPSALLRHCAYALPALPLAALYLPLFSYVTPFYASERGVDLAALGVAWIAIRLFDAISDPAIGWVSDRTKHWLGRRVWVAVSVPVIGVAVWQAFVPPEGAGLAHAAVWLLLLTLGWTMAQTPYAAWGAELEPGYHGRTQVTAWRESMVLAGTLLATILYFLGGEGGDGLRIIALAVLILLPLSVVAAAFGAGERAMAGDRRLSVSEGYRAMAENPHFRRLLAAWFVNGAANGLPVTLFLFFVEFRLGAADAAGPFLLAYFVAAILGVPVWTRIARRYSKHRAWCWAMLYACVIFAAALTLGEGDLVGFGVIAVLTGLAFGADLVLPPAIQADVVEVDTLRTGARRAGLFFAIWQVATKAALAFSSGIALILLSRAGFSAEGSNDADALWALALLYAGAPILLKLGAVAIMWPFALDARALDEMRPGRPVLP